MATTINPSSSPLNESDFLLADEQSVFSNNSTVDEEVFSSEDDDEEVSYDAAAVDYDDDNDVLCVSDTTHDFSGEETLIEEVEQEEDSRAKEKMFDDLVKTGVFKKVESPKPVKKASKSLNESPKPVKRASMSLNDVKKNLAAKKSPVQKKAENKKKAVVVKAAVKTGQYEPTAEHRKMLYNIQRKRGSYQCPKSSCQYVSSQFVQLIGHLNMIHLHVRPFRCSQCPDRRPWPKPQQLHFHNRRKHRLADKPVGEIVTDIDFYKKLKKHLERPRQTVDASVLPCCDCEFEGYNQEDLNEHYFVNHQVKSKGAKPKNPPDTPNLTGSVVDHVKRSKRVGNYFVCPAADKCSAAHPQKLFDILSHLNVWHLRLKPYKCEGVGCGFAAYSNRSMRAHILSVHHRTVSGLYVYRTVAEYKGLEKMLHTRKRKARPA